MSRDKVEDAAGRENVRPSHIQKLRDIAATIGLTIEYRTMAGAHGGKRWKSKKPWSLRYGDSTLLCAFRTLDDLERNLRARAAC